MSIPTLHSLGLPRVFAGIARENSGLVLVGGAKGSGRAKLFAALLNEVNRQRPVPIVTLETKIAFQHSSKRATVHHWELSRDFNSYAEGLQRASRLSPAVIYVDDVGNRETMTAMLHAAEAGCLVFGLRGDPDVQQMVRHVVGLYPDTARRGVRLCLASSLRWAIALRAVRARDGGQHLLVEVMGANSRIRRSIEGDGPENIWSLREIIEESWAEGWQCFDQAAIDAYESGQITEADAISSASRRTYVTARIYEIQRRNKGVGE